MVSPRSPEPSRGSWLTQPLAITLPRYLWGLALLMALFLFAGALTGCRPAPQPPASEANDSLPPSDSLPPAFEAQAGDTADLVLGMGTESGEIDTLALPEPDARRRAIPRAGVALSLFNWPDHLWGAGPISGPVTTAQPQYVAALLRSWRGHGARGWIVVPRSLLTETGRVPGRFSVTRAKRVAELYRAKLSASEYAGYVQDGTLSGFVIMDDVRCLHCWGNRKVSGAEVAPMAQEFRRLLPAVPIFVRVTPDWHLEYGGWGAAKPGSWAQYNKIRGPLVGYFREHVEGARRFGSKIILGVNVNDCYRANVDTPCTADELRTFYGEALTHMQGTGPACALSGWKWTSEDWSSAARREAYAEIVRRARALPLRDCRP
jgi:hypothetical protein